MNNIPGYEDLEFQLDEEVTRCFHERRLLITGAAGSIGSELARQLSRLDPSRLFLLDKDENSLYEIGLELREDSPVPIREVVANIREPARLEQIFERFKPEVVFHAAAYKHVPMMERDPGEAILTNIA
ncbi:MAG: polysaccharide biosynthesis protein, partial [Acidobacteriota bacterium]